MEENLELEAEGCSCDEGLMIGRKTTTTATGSLILGCDHGMQVGADYSFVIDMHNFSHGGPNKEANQTPRITKSFSRKGSQRGEKKRMSSNNATVAADRDTDPLIAATSSPTAMVATSMPEKASAVGSIDLSGSHKVHHQIAINAVAAAPETGKFGLRRNSFKRPPPPWLLNPKRILIFFATISSIGTILLIFFTLTTSKMNGDQDSPHDLQT